MSLEKKIEHMAREAKSCCRELRTAGSDLKNHALYLMEEELDKNRQIIIAQNRIDLDKARAAGLSSALIDRLTISPQVLDAMIDGIREVRALPDPVGEITHMQKRPNGLDAGRIRIPIGVIGFIYESRPNVTVDAAALCLKSGNAVILKGGSEALESNIVLGRIINDALEKSGLPPKAVQVIPSTERAAVSTLLGLENLVDLIIPRGGENLIRFVAANSRIPVLKHYKGVCHVYVDKNADLKMAEDICFNAKVQRPGVCNAMETLLVHETIAMEFLSSMAARYQDAGVEIRGCPKTCRILPSVKPADESDWDAEYLDLILSIKVVPGIEQALDHIERYGSNHTEAIITKDYAASRRFLTAVDASAVMVNASTRFNDGNQLGLGAEIGISTSKLHAYGPMGLEELTSSKFIVYGDGQVRE